MSITVRQIGPGEPDTVMAVLDALVADRTLPEDGSAENPDLFLDDPNTFLVAAFEHERPVGQAWGVHVRYPNGRQMTYLHHIEVAPGHRDRGVGSMLMDVAFELASQRGSAKFWLSTGMHNTGAQRLYDRLGGDRKELGDVNYWWDLTDRS